MVQIGLEGNKNIYSKQKVLKFMKSRKGVEKKKNSPPKRLHSQNFRNEILISPLLESVTHACHFV